MHRGDGERTRSQHGLRGILAALFPALYAYTSEASDIGNSEDLRTEAKLHLGFFYKQLARVVKPGRSIVVHVMQIPRMKRAGETGLNDFRGMNIRLGERAGLVWEYDWLVRKNPQAQAIRTHSLELQFAGLESDRARCRGALGDYLLKFRVPGENAVKVRAKGEVTRNDWIKWAEACWDDIVATDTLNVAEGKGKNDTKHICLARDSLVLTQEGYRPIQELAVGDMVLTHKGRWMPIIAVACTGTKPVVRLEAQGVPGLRLTPDHRIWTRCGVGGGRWPGMPGGKSHPRKTAKTDIAGWVPAEKTLGGYINLKLPPTEPSPYTKAEWWIIGRWLADGHWDGRGRNLVLSCGRTERDALAKKLGSRCGAINKVRTGFQMNIKDRDGHLREVLRQCGKYCHGKRVPSSALSLEPEYAASFLDGYLSGDGHYVTRYSRHTASSVSRSLLLGMAIIAQRVHGVAASVYAGRKAGKTTIEGRLVPTMQEWVLGIPPKNLSGFVLDDGAWKKVRKITDDGKAEVWSIQVAEDASFTAEGCVVKNCPLQLEVIRRMILLFTDPGEIVFSPFAGIGSEGYVARGGASPKTNRSIALQRRFYGCEIKSEYVAAARMNLTKADTYWKNRQRDLFTMAEATTKRDLFTMADDARANSSTGDATPPATA